MRKILVVDDNPLSVEGILRNIPWEILQTNAESACDGYAAIEKIKETKPDLIISDIDMPGIDGISMCQKALEIVPDAKILLISAYDKFEYAKRAIQIGVFDYIEKPISYTYLTEKIRNALTLMEEEAANRELIEKSRPLLTQKFFEDLLNYSGSNAKETFRQYPDYLRIPTDYHYYNVVKIEITNSTEVESRYGIVRYQMDVLRMTDYIRQYGSMFDWTYSFCRYNEIICCIGQNTNVKEHFLTVIRKFADALLSVSSQLLVDVNIGIGVIQSSFWQLHAAWENAANAIKYKFCFPHDSIFDANDMEQHSFTLTDAAGCRDDALLRLIGSGTEAQISSWLTDYFQKLLAETASERVIFIRIYSLVGKILKFLYETNIDSSDLEPEIARLYSRSDSFDSYEQLRSWLESFCFRVRQKMDFSTESYHTQLCKKVRHFIDQNYSDNNLGLDDLSKYIGVSSAYLSALYKKVTGVNIGDTISEKRISHACRLLKETDLPLKDISLQCGFSNQYYFSSCFKKKTGCSPSQYRSDPAQSYSPFACS